MSKAWWKEMAVYQVFPRSFKDSNGDGVGDIRGITMKANYLEKLGVNTIWLCPCYKSPNADGGYDISDYMSINPDFGTFEDWNDLVKALNARHIKLIMDLQLNHTSDEHPWFKESRMSKDESNSKRNYYIWRDGKGPDGKQPPNNWSSQFQGSAWTYDEGTHQFYLHLFHEKQPDLNWDNPEVRKEAHNVMKYWFDKGVDGLRLAVINLISKVEGLPDGKVEPNYPESFVGLENYANGPHLHEYLREINQEVAQKYPGRVLIGECPFCKKQDLIDLSAEDRSELHYVCSNDFLSNIDSEFGHKFRVTKYTLPYFKNLICQDQDLIEHKAWKATSIGNHDYPRCVSRFGDDSPQFREHSATLLATMNHTLMGTPYIYQGEEIGMTNTTFDTIEDFKDIEVRQYWRYKVLAHGKSQTKALEAFKAKARDHSRSPFQWDPSDNAGFTVGTPWTKVNPNFTTINSEEALMDPDSIFHYYRKLIALRHQHDVIVYGVFKPYFLEDEDLFVYTKKYDGKTLLVVLNFSKEVEGFRVPDDVDMSNPKLLISNYPNNDNVPTILRPYEAIVYLI